MSINKLVRQSLSLMEGFTTMPFQIVRQLWGNESSNTGKIVKQTAYMSEQLVAMPFRLAREVFTDGTPENSSYQLHLQNREENQEKSGENSPSEQT